MAKLGRYSANRIKVQEKTADYTIEVNDCGTLFVVNPTADTTLTLPAPSAAGKGWWVEVMIDEEDGGTVDKDVNINVADGTFFTGLLVVMAAVHQSETALLTISFVLTKAMRHQASWFA